jgi:hypothetical protein
MPSIKRIVLALLTVVMVSGTMGADLEARRARGRLASGESLSAQEADWLQFMRQEEDLAWQVYRLMHETWGAPVFRRIMTSEERHVRQVARMLARYGLPDPMAGNADGTFDDADLQALYGGLVESGAQSLPDALRAGALIEETDIADLEKAIGQTTHADLARMYGSLLAASENHLRAFAAQLEALAEPYIPRVLPRDRFDSIVNQRPGI